MKIRNKIVMCYDVAVYEDAFLFVCRDTESLGTNVFNISWIKGVEDVVPFLKFLARKDRIWCGFNNTHFANPILNRFIQNCLSIWDDHTPYTVICRDLHDTKKIITSQPVEQWEHLKYTKFFRSFDIMSMVTTAKNRATMHDLRVFYGMPKLPAEVDKRVVIAQESAMAQKIEDMSTDLLLMHRLLTDHAMAVTTRAELEPKYRTYLLSKDNVSVGMEIFKKEYLSHESVTWDSVKDGVIPPSTVSLSQILYNIQFNSSILQDIMTSLYALTVVTASPTLDFQFHCFGLDMSMTASGLRSINKPRVFVAKDNAEIWYLDVESMFPSFAIKKNIHPAHLSYSFITILEKLKDAKTAAAASGDLVTSRLYKDAINGIIGNMNKQGSWLYSPVESLKIRLNAQLYMLKLCEMLHEAGAELLQVNTDGIFCIVPYTKNAAVSQASGTWQGKTSLHLKLQTFNKLVQYSLNDYIAIGNSGIKKAGVFNDKKTLGHISAPPIIAKALSAYFMNKIPISYFLHSSTDIRDFITGYKDPQGDVLYWEENNVGKSPRIVYVIDHPALMVRRDFKYIPCTDTGVLVCNDISSKDIKSYHLDYQYYTRLCNNICVQLETTQTSLFE